MFSAIVNRIDLQNIECKSTLPPYEEKFILNIMESKEVTLNDLTWVLALVFSCYYF